MSITDLVISDTLAGSLASELVVRITWRRPARADLRPFVLTVVAIVLAVADPCLPNALAAGTSKLSRAAV